MQQVFFQRVNELCRVCPGSWESGDRTPHHNVSVGGKSASYHLKGLAQDLIYDSVIELVDAAREALRLGFQGIEMDLTNNHLHVDGRISPWQVVRHMQEGVIREEDLVTYLTTRDRESTLRT